MNVQRTLIGLVVLLVLFTLLGVASVSVAAPIVSLQFGPPDGPEPGTLVVMKESSMPRLVQPKAVFGRRPVATAMSEGFEAAWPATGWQIVDGSNTDGGEYLWGKRNCHPHSGTYGGWAVGGGAQGNALACGSNYPNNANVWATYGPFDLSNATAASLSFHIWGKSQTQGASCADFLYAGSFTNDNDLVGDGWCGDATGGPAGNGYYRLSLDLDNRLGASSVWIAFVFVSDDSVSYEGFTIDDVTLDVSGSMPPAAAKAYLPLMLVPGGSAPSPTATPTPTRTTQPLPPTPTPTRTTQPLPPTPTPTRTTQPLPPTPTPTRTTQPLPPTPTPTRTTEPPQDTAFDRIHHTLTTPGSGTIFGLDTSQCTFDSAHLYIYYGPQPCGTPQPQPRSDAERRVLISIDDLFFRAGYNLIKADYPGHPLADATFGYPDPNRLRIAFSEETSLSFSGDVFQNDMQVTFSQSGGNAINGLCQYFMLDGQFSCPVTFVPQSEWSPLPVTGVVIRELPNHCIRVNWVPAPANVPGAAPAQYSLRLSEGGSAPFLNDIRAPGDVSTFDDCSSVATLSWFCGFFQDTVFAIGANGRTSSPASSSLIPVCRIGSD